MNPPATLSVHRRVNAATDSDRAAKAGSTLAKSTTILLVALAGTGVLAGRNFDVGMFLLSVTLVVHLAVVFRWWILAGKNTRVVWARVSAAACLETAALWFGIAFNQVRSASLPDSEREQLEKKHYFSLDQDPGDWAVFVVTGFPLQELVMIRARERPEPVKPPKSPSTPNVIGSLGFNRHSYLFGHSLHVLWTNFGILTLVAGVGVSLLKGRWLANTQLAAVVLAILGTSIHAWMLINLNALLPSGL